MSKTKRINPETGVLEEDKSIFDGLFGRDWQPSKNKEGNAQRINPETGVLEEDKSIFDGLFGRDWQPKK